MQTVKTWDKYNSERSLGEELKYLITQGDKIVSVIPSYHLEGILVILNCASIVVEEREPEFGLSAVHNLRKQNLNYMGGNQNATPAFKRYKREGTTLMREYVPGEDLTGVSISDRDKALPSLDGGYIAKDDEGSTWYVSPTDFESQKYKEVELETA